MSLALRALVLYDSVMPVDHPTYGNMCAICFCHFTLEDCAIDEKGIKWDVHSGFCAIQAGIKEPEVRAEHKCGYNEAMK